MIATLTRGGDHVLSAPAPGSGPDTVGRFEGATVFTVGPSGQYYVLLGERDELIRLETGGTVDGTAGGYGWGETGFDRPTDVSVPNDLEVYISDYGNDRIIKLDRSLGISSVFETVGETVIFRFPLSLCVTAFGKILVVDGEYGRVVEISRDNKTTRIFGARGSGPGSLDLPVRVRTDGDSLIVVQDRNGLVLYDIYGNYLRTLTRDLIGKFALFTFGNGTLLVLDTASVRRLSMSGELIGEIPLPKQLSGEPLMVVDMVTDGKTLSLLMKNRIVRLVLPVVQGQ